MKRRSDLEPIDFDGLAIYDYTAGEAHSSSLAAIDVPAGAAHAESWSTRSDKYYLVTDGALAFTLTGESFTLAAGDFCLVHKGSHFAYRNDGDQAARVVLVHTPSFELAAERFVEGK